jgi:hypothetical protein
MTPEELSAYRKRQHSRAVATGIVLAALAILFFAITIAKMS